MSDYSGRLEAQSVELASLRRNLANAQRIIDEDATNCAKQIARIAELEAIVEQRNKMCSDYFQRIAELELLIDDLTAAISNPQQWKGGHLSQMALQNARIEWYALCGPLRERARKALEEGG